MKKLKYYNKSLTFLLSYLCLIILTFAWEIGPPEMDYDITYVSDGAIIYVTAHHHGDKDYVDGIELPNGVFTSDNPASYKVTSNGEYVFASISSRGHHSSITVKIGNIDSEGPIGSHTLSNSNLTNKDVVININATDESGVKRIKLPNGTYINGSYASYTVNSNNNYLFVLEDSKGNTTNYYVNVTNINKVLPVITVLGYNTSLTNQDVVVNVITDKGNLNTTSYTFSDNGSFEFVATDAWGNVSRRVVTITNIDKVLPTVNTLLTY